MAKRQLTFMGAVPAGPCQCPCCQSAAKVMQYPRGEKWTTLICPRCGWYQVPTEYAPRGTEFTVMVKEIVEVMPHGKK